MSPQRTLVKICGITNAADAKVAVDAGADAIGVVFAPSKRQVSVCEAAAALAGVPAHIARIGVFVDADPALVEEAVRVARLSVVQFHGSETPEQCEAAPAPVVKAVHAAGADSRAEFERAVARYGASTVGLLVDTYDASAAGGTGRTFDWEALGSLEDAEVPVYVAGGLTPDNVAHAVRTLRPYAVDVSSGVETAPGRKDADAVRAFVQAVRAIDQEVSS